MNTKLLILPQIALAALLMTVAGCRTYSPTRANSQAKSFQIQIPAGTAVRVCLPEEGRYYQALFQAPIRHDPKALPPPE